MTDIMKDSLIDYREWQSVSANLWKIKVEGGWIYQCTEGEKEISMCFVPDIDLTRYQAHLRDAYNQGFKDGQDDLSANSRNKVQLSK